MTAAWKSQWRERLTVAEPRLVEGGAAPEQRGDEVRSTPAGFGALQTLRPGGSVGLKIAAQARSGSGCSTSSMHTLRLENRGKPSGLTKSSLSADPMAGHTRPCR